MGYLKKLKLPLAIVYDVSSYICVKRGLLDANSPRIDIPEHGINFPIMLYWEFAKLISNSLQCKRDFFAN